MSKYIIFGTYTAETLAAVRNDGYVTRVEINRRLSESLGGGLECMYFMTASEWDFFAIGELSSEAVFAIVSGGNATGAFQRIQAREIRTAEEADEITSSGFEWVAPGQGSR
jgi:uncharacterized protein with GYD domain